MTIGLRMAEKKHFEKVPDKQQQTTEDRWTAHGLLMVGPELSSDPTKNLDLLF